MRKQFYIIIILILCAVSSAQTDLVITEIMSESDHVGVDGDWWELTNTGSEVVVLTDYSWDDSHRIPGNVTFTSLSIGAGESVIILDEPAANVDAWKTVWELGSDTRVWAHEQFVGNFHGLGGSDGVYLYDSNDALVTSANYSSRTDRVSNEWDKFGTFLGLSVMGENGAYRSTDAHANTASPGYAVDLEPCRLIGPSLYWTDKDAPQIQRLIMDCNQTESLTTPSSGFGSPRGIAIDAINGRVYWADFNGGSIHRCSLDGSHDQVLVTGLETPADMALDTDMGLLYWAETDAHRICRMATDSNHLEVVIDQVSEPYYIALDLVHGQLYWSEFNSPTLNRMDLMSNEAEVYLTGLDRVRDIVVEPEQGKVYWADRDSSKIQRANLDGTEIEDLFNASDGLDRPHGLWLDVETNQIYWTDTRTQAVHRGCADGSGVAEVFIDGLDGPWALVMVNLENILYVDANAPGLESDGSSWAKAYRYLQDALAAASPGDTIRIAQGTYRPDCDQSHPSGTGDRTATFALDQDLVIQGGYAGYGQTDPNQRDTVNWASVLSGDLAGNDQPVSDARDLLTEPARSENCLHVLTGQCLTSDTVLDGLTITGGNANDYDILYGSRGGAMLNHSICTEVNPVIRNCHFINNTALELGGALLNSGHGDRQCNLTLAYCQFSNNAAGQQGGAIFNNEADPNVMNCRFDGNYAAFGGGAVLNSGSDQFETGAVFRNCVFANNTTTTTGAGMYNGPENHSVLTNCTFIHNDANEGGAGLYNWEMSQPTLVNCILWGNEDDGWDIEAGQILSEMSLDPLITYSCIEGWSGSLGDESNIGDDPRLDGGYHLLTDSPCIDAGDPNGDYSGQKDIDGGDRVEHGRVDIGADELTGHFRGE